MRLLPKEGVLTIGGGSRQPCDFEPVFKDLKRGREWEKDMAER